MEQFQEHAEGHLDRDQFPRMMSPVNQDRSLMTRPFFELNQLNLSALVCRFTYLARFKPVWKLIDQLIDQVFGL